MKAKEIAERAREIMAEYTTKEILKMDVYQAQKDAHEQARQELKANQTE